MKRRRALDLEIPCKTWDHILPYIFITYIYHDAIELELPDEDHRFCTKPNLDSLEERVRGVLDMSHSTPYI